MVHKTVPHCILRDSEESKFVRKLDLYLLTWGCIAYLIKSIDQSNYSNAYVGGMKEDLNIVGNEYNWISTYFNIGYAVGLIPSQISMTRLSTPYWLSSCEFIWGILTLLCFCQVLSCSISASVPNRAF
ncbi:hypothetical protein KL933_001645 [Ogataea haglerorum]|uniref:Uncharacterized protein n=1 Tax=Ogataea haglerorum TaxID=1937702 RepID=A0AAN6I1N6_9ASCO|nr:hypothetical protein KL933_001645 [Ogataea haglerorum]KAG7739788.1 hypothetical protein KL923_002635 [Ogataea haglerorum]